jgi:hypothetical protein
MCLLVLLPYRMFLANLKEYICIYFGELRKTTKNLSQENRFSDQFLKPGPRDYDVLARLARSQVLVFKAWRSNILYSRWLCN